MRKPRSHPGLTGIIEPVHFNIPKDKRREILRLDVAKKLDRFDGEPIFDGLEAACSFYLGAKRLAEQSSAGEVRANLTKTIEAAAKFTDALDALDGNSWQIVNARARARSVVIDIAGIRSVLDEALVHAKTHFPTQGPRPRPERDFLAAKVRDLLILHSSATLTTTPGQLFEEMLRQTFALVGEWYEDLHSLADKVLNRQIITHEPGVTIYDASE